MTRNELTRFEAVAPCDTASAYSVVERFNTGIAQASTRGRFGVNHKLLSGDQTDSWLAAMVLTARM